MQDYQRDFLDFAIGTGVLRFGEFTLKSGRKSPYFFNSGRFDSGHTIGRLGHFYAAAIRDAGAAFDMLYGPAYKGIPLAVAAAIGLNEDFNLDVPYAFNRKEVKDHGEGGAVVGRALGGRVLIVDDVISAGTSVRDSVEIISAAGAEVAGVAIALDRQERGEGERSAIREVEEAYGIPVINIVDLATLITYLDERGDRQGELEEIKAYQSRYGVSP